MFVFAIHQRIVCHDTAVIPRLYKETHPIIWRKGRNQADHRASHQASFGRRSNHNAPKYTHINPQDFRYTLFQLSTMQAIQVMFLKQTLSSVNYRIVTQLLHAFITT